MDPTTPINPAEGGAGPAVERGATDRRNPRRRVPTPRFAGMAVAGLAGLAVAVPVAIRAARPPVPAAIAAPAPGTPLASPAHRSPDAVPGPGPVTLPLDVLADNVIHRADGRRVPLSLPGGATATEATRVPDGWVVAGSADDGADAVFWVGDTGPVRRVGSMSGDHAVDPGGRLLVITGTGPATAVAAYALPSLRLLRATTFDSAMGPLVAGIAGDRVVLRGAQGSPAASRAAVWNLRTGAVRRTGAEIWTWGVSRDGRVLRRVDRAGAGGAPDPAAVCVDVVPPADALATGRTGLCSPRLGSPEGSGAISPDGRWVVLGLPGTPGGGNSSVLMRAADVRAGRWNPVAGDLTAGDVVLFWDTDETFVVLRGERYHRCGVAGPCAPVVVPAGLPEPQLVPRRG